jgi:hypothetical protein
MVFDYLEAFPRSSEIGFRRRALYRRSVPDSVVDEVELDPPAGRCNDAAREPFGTHVGPLCMNGIPRTNPPDNVRVSLNICFRKARAV